MTPPRSSGPEHPIRAGAEPFTLPGGRDRAVVLIHGSGDTPQSLRYLAARLAEGGYRAHVPLLPGHGRAVASLADVRAEDYRATVSSAVLAARAQTPWVALLGLSMGGALAAAAAVELGESVSGLALLAPYLTPTTGVRWAARTAPLWSRLRPQIATRGAGAIHDAVAAAQSLAYPRTTGAGLRALVETADAGRDAIPRLTCPTLVIHATEDIRIPTRYAETGIAALRAPGERHWLARGGHVMTVDYARARVADLVLDFLRILP